MSRIANELQRLICEERFAEVEALLPQLTQHPPEEARECLRSALIAARARRAHYMEELNVLQQQARYLGSIPADRAPGLDVTG